MIFNKQYKKFCLSLYYTGEMAVYLLTVSKYTDLKQNIPKRCSSIMFRECLKKLSTNMNKTELYWTSL